MSEVKRGRGRPRVATWEQLSRVRALVAEGWKVLAACDNAGLSVRTWYRELRREWPTAMPGQRVEP